LGPNFTEQGAFWGSVAQILVLALLTPPSDRQQKGFDHTRG
jgi:hypothetical protein